MGFYNNNIEHSNIKKPLSETHVKISTLIEKWDAGLPETKIQVGRKR